MKTIVAEWSGAEVWIPYDQSNREQQEREMQSMLETGQYEYADARRINDQCYWVLRRLSRKEFRRIVNGRILRPEQVERLNRRASKRSAVEHDTTIGYGLRSLVQPHELFPDIPDFEFAQK